MALTPHFEQAAASEADESRFADDDYGPPPLLLSTASKIWRRQPEGAPGMDCAHGAGPGVPSDLAARPCMYCGFACDANELHHLNDNHQDTRRDNLGVACTLCHRWQHLGDTPSGDAYLCYLPGLSAPDANHLLRTVLVALNSGDAEIREDAHALLNWMASHRDYVQKAWGTCEPAAFSSAILRQSAEEKEWREITFADMALVLRPAPLASAITYWQDSAYKALPASAWPGVYHSIINAPL